MYFPCSFLPFLHCCFPFLFIPIFFFFFFFFFWSSPKLLILTFLPSPSLSLSHATPLFLFPT
jgi:hypothetical protein